MIAPDTTQIQTERPHQRTASLIYPLPISVSGLMLPSRRNLEAVVQESYSMRQLQGLNITFLTRQSNFIQLHSRDHSPPSIFLFFIYFSCFASFENYFSCFASFCLLFFQPLSIFKPLNALYSKFERLKILGRTSVRLKLRVPGWGDPPQSGPPKF